MGSLLAESGRVDEAIEHYRRAVAADPELTAARLNLAAELLRRGDAAGALPHFEATLEREPLEEQALLGRGVCLGRTARYREAVEHLEQARARLPTSHRVAHALARLLAAAPDDALRDGARALELAHGVQQVENSSEAAETRAMALAELGRFDEAVRWQEATLRVVRAGGTRAQLRRVEENLRRYRSRRPCRQPWPN